MIKTINTQKHEEEILRVAMPMTLILRPLLIGAQSSHLQHWE